MLSPLHNRILTIVALFAMHTLWPPLLVAQSEQAVGFFEQGLELQLERDYDGALAAYTAAEATGWTSTELLLNTSAAALSSGDLGRARLAAERAALLSPRDADVQHNIEVIRHAAGETAIVPRNIVQSVRFSIEAIIGRTGLLIFSWIFWMGFLILAGVFLLGISRKPLVRRSLLILSPIVLITLLMTVEAHRDRTATHAVAMSPTPLYLNAGEEHARITEIPAGRLLRIRRSEGDWREVRLASGEIGWIPGGVIEQIR